MYYEYDNIKIHYDVYENKFAKKNILILPGWGEVKNTFYNLINYFRSNYNIYFIDYPSFGNSPIPDKDLTIYDYSMLVKNFIIDLELDDPYIIAHSFGGRIATILSGLYKLKLSKMVFIDTAGVKPRKTLKRFIKEKTYKFLKFMCTKLFKRTKKQKIRKLREIFSSSDYNSLPDSMLTTFRNIVNEDLKRYYDDIDSNVLLIWGKKDIDTPFKDAKFMKKHIKNSSLVVFNEATHFSYLEYSYAINVIIEDFIEN